MNKAGPAQTEIRRIEQYRDRWSSFGERTGLVTLSAKPSAEILERIDLFADYDAKFLEKISADVSIANWEDGAILFEEGSYIDVAFFIIKGEVELYLAQDTDRITGPMFDASRTMPVPGQESSGSLPAVGKQRPTGKGKGPSDILFLSTMDFDLPRGGAIKLRAGDVFGEIGALSGWPQGATARTAGECQLVHIRLPALRLMRRKSKAFKQRLDDAYRERSLITQLKATPMLRGSSDEFISRMADKVELISLEPDEIVAREGDPSDAVYLVRSGFIKLRQRVGEGEMTVSYLSKGSTFGEAELLLDAGEWVYTASSQAYAELVKFSRGDIAELISERPAVEAGLWETVVARTKEAGRSRRDVSQSEFLHTALERGLVEGNSILMIDLDTCTRCDDCVRGCAETHDGIPRFVREGEKYNGFLVTRACYHCRDPLCLVGCPTGAIRRTDVGHVVAIDDDICIGCGSCAGNCPYNAITMFDMESVWPDDAIPKSLRGEPRLLATKCDLCYTNDAGPACVRSCPQGCAVRVGTIDEFREILVDR